MSVHTDEIYFRDTAHGLLVWALGAVISLSLLTSAASSLVSGVAHAGAAVAQSAGNAIGGAAGQVVSEANSSGMGDPNAYFTDMLFRTDHPAPSGDAATSHTEVARILATDAASGDMPAADKTYVAQVVAARTGLSQTDAEKRVSDVVEQAKNSKGRSGKDRCRRRPQDRRACRFVGFHLAADRRVFSKLYGDGRR